MISPDGKVTAFSYDKNGSLLKKIVQP
ncbi:hypothetical protein [Paenibacillus sp. S150]|nr:hypothetical protein [Paenibacillus sp. S150]